MKVKIGVVAKPFGIRGEIKVKPMTDFAKERFSVGSKMELVTKNARKVVEIQSVRNHQDNLLIRLVGYDTLNDVEGLQLSSLEVERDDLHDLEEDEYYFVDLVGCNAYIDNQEIGSVIEVMDMPAQPLLRIKRLDNGEILMVPFVEVFIKDVNLDEKRIDINPMDGLL
ncbi:hypothetical protein AOC36_04530 [Erysipelothrix larvae]|uniref:Ribosome maturation factor RimM n=1 Tax=Erysipelothrix larvae TaxID=1514105 RepID=A0A0X8GZG3_9FIRM|nr:ribosome maturation factor RimM [Erysipelothrix larvae]AMC93262.1 hypothetical protein AOC36_04530 [Erysipelothrix larvae]